MKTLKAILLLGLLTSSASALAEKIGVSMAYFDQNFLTIIRHAIDKEAKARGLDAQFEDARGDVGRRDRCRVLSALAWMAWRYNVAIMIGNLTDAGALQPKMASRWWRNTRA